MSAPLPQIVLRAALAEAKAGKAVRLGDWNPLTGQFDLPPFVEHTVSELQQFLDSWGEWDERRSAVDELIDGYLKYGRRAIGAPPALIQQDGKWFWKSDGKPYLGITSRSCEVDKAIERAANSA